MRVWRLPVVVGVAFVLFLVQAAPTGAKTLVPSPRAPRAEVPTNTELVWRNHGPYVANIVGFVPLPDFPFDPLKGYPAENPSTGFQTFNYPSGAAGVIYGYPTDGSPGPLSLYCIDILTDTYPGMGYGLGTWDEANVPNVGYVARLLAEYFPTNPNEPAGLNDNQKAAAVQFAIWFFSDGFVLNTTEPTGLRATVVDIVNHILEQGPLPEPRAPSLRITPPHDSGPAGTAVGPFKVETDQPQATVTATGGTMYSNRAGIALLGDGTTATVHNDEQIWLRSTGPTSAVLRATAVATVPEGNVYLYDGNTAPYAVAQKLILGKTATLTTNVDAIAEFAPPGSLVVTKRIAGPAAGSQGPIVISVACSDGVTRPLFVIRAGVGAGTRSRTYADIPARTECTVTETSNGGTTTTTVVVRGDGQEVTIPAGETETVRLTDIYSPSPATPGSLLVTKTIAGPSAGRQGPVTIHVVCNGTALSPDFVIAARTPAGTVSHSFEGIPPGSVCTVTETADGATDTVIATVSGNGQNVTIPPDTGAAVSLMDVYDDGDATRDPGPIQDGSPPAMDRSGFLTVTKTIAGPAAREHGRVAILVACGGVNDYAFIIPAHTGPGSVTRHFDNIPSGVRCTVTETANGHTSTVAVAASGSGKTVTIPATGGATVHLTDTFSTTVIPSPPFTG